MENQPSRQCPHCQDLTPCYLFVQVPELLEGAKIKAIAVSVDCALYIYAYLKDANEYTVIELSSPAGQPSRWKNIGPARPAAELTRALGFRYLWIDSLCIVQDDPNDWAIEAAKMNHVYHNAALTMSADGAENPAQGLFARPAARVSANNTVTLMTEDPTGRPVEIYARLRCSPPSDPDSAPHSSFHYQKSKLSTRGWVVQERILSPRMVHFYNEELVWSCFGLQRLAPSQSSTTAGATVSSLAPGHARSLLIEWTKLVELFSHRDLTYAKDRLPALSGIARLVHSHLPSSTRYLAGLWSIDMAYSLLWIADHGDASEKDEVITRIPVTPYAPSWSWASIVGPIRYMDRHLDQFTHRRSGKNELKPELEVLHAVTVPPDGPNTANPYGPVSSGAVVVRAQVLPVIVDPESGDWRPAPNAPGTRVRRKYKPPKMPPMVIPDVLEEYMRIGGEAIVRESSRPLVMLRAATFIWDGTMSTPSTEVVALLLEMVEPGQNPSAEKAIETIAGADANVHVYVRRGVVLHAFHKEEVWAGVETKTVVIV
ncbi:hypothetical protein VTJ04DRAFT_10857 [Mycothermus thermophilus]|uniref:uncharacterized protein n=1 Tax=Humicola insolens TaxID=85995 RepID=UPI0037429104